ncbi:MAG TPA: pyridoxal-phosphate dependent enzyme [Vicinamibacterales bacterium]|nr:pyridoxal-phosphate dependent enzyme [Vicinamibacterales bacterium]
MSSLASTAPTRADIEAAARRVRGIAFHTPMVRADWLSDVAHAEVWLKLEATQTTGSFKLRGAANAIAVIAAERPHVRRIMTASAGNHGRAVAYAARRAGLAARIYVPASAPAVKRNAMVRLGAEVIETASYDDAEARAQAEGAREDTAFVSAYSHRDIIAGAGTVALEMFEDVPGLDTIIAPIGGGGLISGSAIVARSLGRDTRVIAAEAAASPVFTAALAAGRVTTVNVGPSLADGLVGNIESDTQTFDIVRRLVDRVVSVDEPSFARAMRELIQREQLVSEAAGAAGVAAILQGAADVRGRHVGVVLSGRNVDADVIARVLSA